MEKNGKDEQACANEVFSMLEKFWPKVELYAW